MVGDALPRVRLFGRPAVRDDEGRWREFPSGLRAGALGYLAFAQRWVARDELVALFWPDRPEATARGNLRPLLTKLAREQRAVGFEREPTRIRWLVRSDLAAFLEARRGCRWSDAWRLVGGELLEGVSVRRAPEFEGWLEIERASVRDDVRTVGLHVADEALETGALDDASVVLATLQRADPLDEVVLRRGLVALARRGARGEALAAFESFVERCHDELGAEPEAATLELAEAIRIGREGTVLEYERAPRTNGARQAPAVLPAPLTELIGRRLELGEIVARLEDPACRLLTLIGPGGVGKTRLALEVAHVVAASFADGARVVDLAAVSHQDGVLASIAEAVGLRLDEHGEGVAQVLRWLSMRHLLIVLDNVEHLACVPPLVQDMLAAAPELRILATSRVALGSAAECRYDVPDLPHREILPSDLARYPRTTPDGARGTDESSPSDAAALFVAAGRRAAPPFDPGAHEIDVIEAIVGRLEGAPLAIELAAGWLRVLDVEAIEDELERGIDLLESHVPGRSQRHASMRQVLEASWSLLQPRERAAMRRIAAFRGGFTLDAAREVAELELPALLALVNKSFLRRGGDGRFSRHPLVWHVARERALARMTEFDETRERHASFYLRLLAERRFATSRPDGGRLLDEIQVDLANFVAAWRWAVAHGRHAWLRDALGGLLVFRSARGRYRLIEDLLTEALAVAHRDDVLRGLLQAGLGYAKIWVGGGDHGEGMLREGVRVAEGRVGTFDWAWLQLGLGLSLRRQGRHEEARSAFEAAEVACRQLGDANAELTMRNNIAMGVHDVSEALGLLRALEARARALEATPVLGSVLTGIAGFERLLGEFARAERTMRARQAYVVDAETVSFVTFGARIHRTLVYLEGGRIERAEALACGTLRRRAFVNAREQFADVVVGAAALLGRVALVRREFEGAMVWSRRALDQHRSVHGPDAGFDYALETLARVALAGQDHDEAAAWLAGVGRGPDPWWYHGRLIGEARRVGCRCCEAEVALAQGEIDVARAVLRGALARATHADLVAAALGLLVSAARYFRVVGEAERAERMLRYVCAHPRATFEARASAAFELGVSSGEVTVGRDDGIVGVHEVASSVATALAATAPREA